MLWSKPSWSEPIDAGIDRDPTFQSDPSLWENLFPVFQEPPQVAGRNRSAAEKNELPKIEQRSAAGRAIYLVS
jgi:hypothetical protein